MSVDRYLNKRYDRGNYNCAHLVCEVWKELTGIDISSALRGVLTSSKDRVVNRRDWQGFRRIQKPISPCLVMMNPPGSREPHAGIFIRGKILHIAEGIGVLYQLPEVVGLPYKTLRYYRCV